MITTDADGPHSIAASTISFTTAPDGKTMTRLEGDTDVVVKTPKTETAPERVISAPHAGRHRQRHEGTHGCACSTGGASFVENVRGGARETGVEANRQVAEPDAEDRRTARRDRRGALRQEREVHVRRRDGRCGSRGVFRVSEQAHAAAGAAAAKAISARHRRIDDCGRKRSHHDLPRHAEPGRVWRRGDADRGPEEHDDAPKDTGFFNSTESTIGTADEFHYDDQAKTTHYLGKGTTPALVRQKDSTVSGDDVLVHTDTQDLERQGQRAFRDADCGQLRVAVGNDRRGRDVIACCKRRRRARRRPAERRERQPPRPEPRRRPTTTQVRRRRRTRSSTRTRRARRPTSARRRS